MNTTPAVNRDDQGRFLPGSCPNPSGRPKSDIKIAELARQHTEAAIKTLAEIAADKNAPHSARIHAATALLDRAWGKPPVSIEANVTSTALEDWIATAMANEQKYIADGLVTAEDPQVVTVMPVEASPESLYTPAQQQPIQMPVEQGTGDSWATQLILDAQRREQQILAMEARAMGI